MQFTDFDALQTPSPDRQALLEVIREALDAALEQDHQQLQAVLTYARVQPNGITDRPTVSRQLSLPTDSADPNQVADAILDSFLNRAPGEGFQGQIRVEFFAESHEENYALGVYERLVQIGNVNHQMPGMGGHLPHHGGQGQLPPPHFPPPSMPQGGGYGYGMNHEVPSFGQGPVPPMDDLTEEQHGMLMARAAADERRTDALLRQQQYLLDKVVEMAGTNQQNLSYVMQLAAHYMNRYTPPSMPAPTGGGGADSPIAAVIGGLMSLFMNSKGGNEAPAYTPPPEPQVPPSPSHRSPPPMEDAFHEPPGGQYDDSFSSSDITEDMAAEWSANNPDAAKRVARNLLPPAMQGLIPK